MFKIQNGKESGMFLEIEVVYENEGRDEKHRGRDLIMRVYAQE